jgi:tryptophan-rich sensory protein
MRKSGAIALVVWVLICFGAAGLGSIGSANSPEFYRQLNRPEWAPPPWLFGPVWTVLYALQAISAWMVWRRREMSFARPALVLFVVQLAANALWTWIFFAWRQGAASFVEILILVGLVGLTIILFGRVRRIAAFLMLPYLLWISFAAGLTYELWKRNPQLLGN